MSSIPSNPPELGSLAKAPIAEAVLDIFVEGLAEAPMDSLEQFGLKYLSEYPNKKQKHSFTMETHAEIKPNTPMKADVKAASSPLGWLFSSSDEISIFQARRDGFTSNRLRPYCGWNPFRDESRRLWTDYRNTFNPRSISKISLRYINNIVLPSGDISDYFAIGPALPEGFPIEFANFLMRFSSAIEDAHALLNCTFGFGPNTNGAFVLDFSIESTTAPQTEEELWDSFERFRILKNIYFKQSITPKLLEELRA
jgi:uncharacterized protein (TIGR04255 family)